MNSQADLTLSLREPVTVGYRQVSGVLTEWHGMVTDRQPAVLVIRPDSGPDAGSLVGLNPNRVEYVNREVAR